MTVSYLTKVGLARETTWGSSTAPVALLPVDPPTFTPAFDQVLDQSLRGLPALDYAAYQGVGRVEASMEGNFYPEELGYLLFSAMGSCVSSGTAVPYTHTFSLGSHPPGLSIQDENGIQNYRYTGCMVSELTLTFNSSEGMLRWSSSLVGKQKINVASGTIPAESTSAPFLSWMIEAEVGGVKPFGKIIEGEITLSRDVNLHFVDGSLQTPGTAYVGPLEVTGRATVFFDADADYNRYLDKLQEPVAFTWAYGAGTAYREVTFEAGNMDFGDSPAEVDRSGASVTLAYTMRALYHAAYGGQCRWTLKNSRTSY
jgi:hypothetical protein